MSDKSYNFLPEGCKLIFFTDKQQGKINLVYKPAPRMKVKEESFDIEKYNAKGFKASGVRLTAKPVKTLKFSS